MKDCLCILAWNGAVLEGDRRKETDGREWQAGIHRARPSGRTATGARQSNKSPALHSVPTAYYIQDDK